MNYQQRIIIVNYSYAYLYVKRILKTSHLIRKMAKGGIWSQNRNRIRKNNIGSPEDQDSVDPSGYGHGTLQKHA
jgi:hypothetical protein